MPHAHARPAVIAVRLRSAAFGALLTLAAIGLFALAQHVLRPANAALPAVVEGQPLPSLAPMLERVTPAVVNIHSKTVVRVRNPMAEDPFFRHFFGLPMVPQERVQQSLGSGVVVDAANGYVITNNHVIEGADDISVTLADGRTVSGRKVGADPDSDVAVIRIEATGLKALPLADSDRLRVGDFVVAVGNPFGLGQTVTSGIVSALGRSGLRGLNVQNFIQTDASINPGNSGGALVNLRGELIGINTAIFTPSGGNVGIGFAIPASLAREVMRQLLAFGAVRRGTLGVQTQDLDAQLAEMLKIDANRGAVVTRVLADSAAERAGLQPGDVISAIDGKPVGGRADLANLEGLLPVGEAIELRVLREGRPLTLRARLEAPSLRRAAGVDLARRLDGASLAERPPRNGRKSGVMVAAVGEGSAAQILGLAEGDTIVGVNRREAGDLEALQTLLAAAAGGRAVLSVVRDQQLFLVVLR
ncbi:MAG: Do family serine endopeptidase [Pseudomonadota bacterium]